MPGLLEYRTRYRRALYSCVPATRYCTRWAVLPTEERPPSAGAASVRAMQRSQLAFLGRKYNPPGTYILYCINFIRLFPRHTVLYNYTHDARMSHVARSTHAAESTSLLHSAHEARIINKSRTRHGRGGACCTRLSLWRPAATSDAMGDDGLHCCRSGQLRSLPLPDRAAEGARVRGLNGAGGTAAATGSSPTARRPIADG